MPISISYPALYIFIYLFIRNLFLLLVYHASAILVDDDRECRFVIGKTGEHYFKCIISNLPRVGLVKWLEEKVFLSGGKPRIKIATNPVIQQTRMKSTFVASLQNNEVASGFLVATGNDDLRSQIRLKAKRIQIHFRSFDTREQARQSCLIIVDSIVSRKLLDERRQVNCFGECQLRHDLLNRSQQSFPYSLLHIFGAFLPAAVVKTFT